MPGPADPRGWIRTARVKRTTIRAVWIANRPGALLTRVVGGSDDGQLLEVSVESFSAGVRIIRARGELGQGSSRWLDRIVDDELAAAPQLLIIELSGLAKQLSTGVSALVRAAFHAGEAISRFASSVRAEPTSPGSWRPPAGSTCSKSTTLWAPRSPRSADRTQGFRGRPAVLAAINEREPS